MEIIVLILEPCLDKETTGNTCFPMGTFTDEYADAILVEPPNAPSSTCHIEKLYGDIALDENGIHQFYLAVKHGNGGNSTFRFFFNTDCDSTSGMQGALQRPNPSQIGTNCDTSNSECSPVHGADLMILFSTKNNADISLYEFNPMTNKMEETNNDIGQLDLGTSQGCTSGQGDFFELSLPLLDLFDPCDNNSCGAIELTTSLSNEGGSTNSEECQQISLRVEFPVNNPPVAVVDPVPPCIYSDTEVCLSGLNSFDPDMDTLIYQWDLDYDGTNFHIDTTGEFVCLIYSPGNYTAALRVIDEFGCADTATTGVVDFVVVDSNNKLEAICTGGLILCDQDMNGIVSVQPSGGTGIYSYAWSEGQTTQVATGLAAGTYTVTVTDGNGCTDICSATVAAATPLTVACTSTPVLCDDMNGTSDDGTATATPAGGTGVYTYAWSEGQTAMVATGLAAGTYTVTVSDGNGCTNTCTSTVAAATALTVACTSTPVLCDDMNGTSDDGTATATPTGGKSPYTYAWTGGQTTQTATGLAAGMYTATVTDANGCKHTCTSTVAAATALTVACTSTPVLCDDMNGTSDDGTATATPTGGKSPYTYAWTGGQTTQTATGLAAGMYTATVTDANGCKHTCTSTVAAATALTVACTSTPVLCDDMNGTSDDGTATATPTGGKSPYTYAWTGGQTTQTATGLAAGMYTATVTDANGCKHTCTSTVAAATALTVACTSTPVLCDDMNGTSDDGTATATPTGGKSPYTYAWTGGQTTQTATGLAAGMYTATVTDANGCKHTCTSTVAAATALTVACTSTPVLCDDMNGTSDDGTATATPTGGKSPYTYAWTGGQTTQTAAGLAAGMYTATVTDANGCKHTCTSTVAAATALTVACTSTPVLCDDMNGTSDDGTATATPTGGKSPHTYAWTGGQTTQTATGLAAGMYTATVTDANGCKHTCTSTVAAATALTVACTSTPVLCDDMNGTSDDGTATATPTGGKSPYTYAWTGGQTTQTATGLAAGMYTATVTDANGCKHTCTSTVAAATALTVACTSTPVWCDDMNGTSDDGTATATPTGGKSPYTYAWTGGQTTQTATGLAAGMYTATVTDANGCKHTCTSTVAAATALTVACTSTPVLCDDMNGTSDDGTATATPTGGKSPYTYAWTGGQTTQTATGLAAGMYTATVTDANGCKHTCTSMVAAATALTVACTSTPVLCDDMNGTSDDGTATATPTGGKSPYTYAWTGGQTTQTATGLAAGMYTATVTDANGCKHTCTSTVAAATALTVACTSTPVLCDDMNGTSDDGTATATPTGGKSPYTYAWTGGQTTQTATGLAAGSYTATVTDANGCQTTCKTTLTNPAAMSCTITPTNPTCSPDGSIVVSVTNGSGALMYNIGSGNQASNTFNGLAAGGYTVTVTDANGCQTTCSTTLTNPATMTCNLTPTNPTCNPANTTSNPDGSIVVNVTNGTGTLMYNIGSGNQASNTFNGLAAGGYTVTVTDANGCQTTCSTTLTNPAAMSCTLTPTNPTCNPSNTTSNPDGSIVVNVTNGSGALMYNIGSGNQASNIFNGLATGGYTVTVTDANGCQTTCSTTLTNPAAMSCTLTPTNPTCNPSNTTSNPDGRIVVNVTNGSGALMYNVGSGNQASNTFNGLAAGGYTVTVTDANGCQTTCSTTLTNPAAMSCTLTPTNPSCHPSNTTSNPDGSIVVNVTNGSGALMYNIGSGNQASNTFNGLAAGGYVVTVTDANGCETTCNTTLSNPVVLTCQITGTDVMCNTMATGSATSMVGGGTSSYMYLWSTGETTANISGLTVGTYGLTVTDSEGCVTDCDVTIGGFSCSISQGTCDTDNLGVATASITGGTQPFTYLWSNGETTASISGLIPGLYTLVVIDANECETECEIDIERCPDCELECLTAFGYLAGEETCFGQFGFELSGWTNGSIEEGSYIFDLYGGTTNCILGSGVLVGQMQVEYTGDTVIVNYQTIGNYTLASTNLYIGCQPIPLSNDVLTVDPSVYPYQHILSDVTTDSYTIDVDDLPCEGVYIIGHAEVCAPKFFECSITSTAVDCGSGNNGTASASVLGGESPYRYVWSNGATTTSIVGLSSGLYTLTVMDSDNCETVCEVLVSYPPVAAPQIGPFCQNDAPADLTSMVIGTGFNGVWSGAGIRDDIFYPSDVAIGPHAIYYVDDIACESATLMIMINEICCPLDYAEVNGRLLIGTQAETVHYETDGILESVQLIDANTTYDSKLEITLKPDFEVKLGRTFLATIDGCP